MGHRVGHRITLAVITSFFLTLCGPLMTVVQADTSCGTWSNSVLTDGASANAVNQDARLGITLVDAGSGTGCKGSFTVTNRTQYRVPGVPDVLNPFTGGYTLQLKITGATGALLEGQDPSSPIFVFPALPQSIIVSPSDPSQRGSIQIQGVMTPEGMAVDSTMFLLRSALSLVPLSTCVVSADELLFVSVRASSHLARFSQLALDPGGVNFEGLNAELKSVFDDLITDIIAQSVSAGKNCLKEKVLQVAGIEVSKKAAFIADRVRDYATWVPKWYYDYFTHYQNVGAVFDYAPPSASPLTTPVSGTWISPTDGAGVSGGLMHLGAHINPHERINQVNFTAWWSTLGRDAPWKVVCPLLAPTHDDVFECDWKTEGVPSGDVLISFDVTDTTGSVKMSPNGIHTIHYTTPATIAPPAAPQPIYRTPAVASNLQAAFAGKDASGRYQYILTWQNNADNATGFLVTLGYVPKTGKSDDSVSTTVPGNVTTFTQVLPADSDLSRRFCFSAAAKNQYGEAPSTSLCTKVDPATGVVIPIPVSRPNAPTNLQIAFAGKAADGQNQWTLTWTNNDDYKNGVIIGANSSDGSGGIGLAKLVKNNGTSWTTTVSPDITGMCFYIEAQPLSDDPGAVYSENTGPACIYPVTASSPTASIPASPSPAPTVSPPTPTAPPAPTGPAVTINPTSGPSSYDFRVISTGTGWPVGRPVTFHWPPGLPSPCDGCVVNMSDSSAGSFTFEFSMSRYPAPGKYPFTFTSGSVTVTQYFTVT